MTRLVPGAVTRRLYVCRTGIQMVRSVELPRGRRLVSWHEVGWGWIVLSVAVFVTLLLAAPSRAAEPEPATVGLHEGTPAPYTGVLLPPGRHRQLLVAESELDKAQAALVAAEDQRRIDAAEAARVLDARTRAWRECEAAQVPPAVERPWGGWPWLVGATAVAGLLVGALVL